MKDNVHPLVTIAIPTYNRADNYLKQTLESALNQTYPNLEIIVSDNCSPDNTKEMVANYADPKIIYFRHAQGLKPIDNFNFCLNRAKGNFFLLLQDDDVIDDDFVEICLKTANYSLDVGIIRTGTRWISPDGNLLKEIPNRACGLSLDAFFRAFIAGKTGLYVCSTLFNTDKLRKIGGFNPKYPCFTDNIAKIKLAAKYGRQDIYEIKASNRKHASEMTFSIEVSCWCDDALDLIDIMCELVSKNKYLLRDEGMKEYSRYSYNLASKIKSPFKRYSTYLIVFKKFKYRYPPPVLKHIIYNTVKHVIYNNPFCHRAARYIKRKILQKQF